MKLTVIRDMESPPGGWRYTVPETGVTITAGYVRRLRQKVEAHLDANSLPIPDEEDLVDAICRESGHGEPWCGAAKPKDFMTISQFVTKGNVSRALKTVMHVLRDRAFVSPEIAASRMAVCTSGNNGEPCPHLTSIGLGCRSGCSEEIREMERIIGKKEDNMEPACGACGCLLRAKVRIANATLDKAEKKHPVQYWEKCWRYQDDGS